MRASSRLAHPVGLEPQGEVEPADGQRLEVVGPVEPGGRVHRGAGRLEQADVRAGGDVRGALEHHVLEEVGEAGAAGLLVARADVVPEVHGDDGRGAVGAQQDPEAVVEDVLADRVRGGRGGHARHRAAGREQVGMRAIRAHAPKRPVCARRSSGRSRCERRTGGRAAVGLGASRRRAAGRRRGRARRTLRPAWRPCRARSARSGWGRPRAGPGPRPGRCRAAARPCGPSARRTPCGRR